MTILRMLILLFFSAASICSAQAVSGENPHAPIGTPADAIAKQIMDNPLSDQWETADVENNLDQIQAIFDKALPQAVMTALSFIRDKLGVAEPATQRFLIVPGKNILVVITHQGFDYIIQKVPLNQLNPANIVERTDRPIFYLFTSGGVSQVTVVDVPHAISTNVGGLLLVGPDDVTVQRAEKALSDIIRNCGGRKDTALADAKTLESVSAFIETKVNKVAMPENGIWLSPPDNNVEIGIDEVTGVVDVAVSFRGGLLTTHYKFNARDLTPEGFQQEGNGDGTYGVTITAKNVAKTVSSDKDTKTSSTFGVRFDLSTEQDATDVAEAFRAIAFKYGWTPSKY